MKSGKRSLRIMLALPLAVMTVIGVMSSVPAAAQTLPSATANLAASDQQILAGGQRAFSITVNQPAATGCGGVLQPTCPAGINWVEIETPPGQAPATTATRQFIALGGTAPTGWTVTPLAPPGSLTARAIRFELPSGGATGNLTFTVSSTVPVPGADITRNWTVSVSSNGGGTTSYATGTLGTTVRVLRVASGVLTGPAKAVGTGKVTGLQSGITVDCTVENFGDRAVTVTPSLSAPGFSGISSPAAQSINPGSSGTFQFSMTADSVSSQTNRTLTCGGSGTNADGASTINSFNNKQFTIPVQPPAVFDYVKVVKPATFLPRAVAPQVNATFIATIRKNPSTSPGVDLNPDTTKLMFKNSDGVLMHEIALGTAIDVAPGAISALQLTFGPSLLPESMTAGVYNVSLDIEGEDKNGQPVSFKPVSSFNETLTIDAGIPIVDNLGIQGVAKPSRFVDDVATSGDEGYAAIQRAARSGQPVPFSGSVLDGLDASSADPSPCAGGTGELQPGECRIVEARLLQYSDFAATMQIPDSTILCPSVSINSSGAIGGSCTATFDTATRAIVAQVLVADAVGLQGLGTSLRLHVDNEIPQILTAHAVRYTDGSGASRQNRVIVTLNECVSLQGTLPGGVSLASRASDWTASTNTVTAVSGPDCPAGSVGDDSGDVDGVSTITLTMQNDYEDDGPFGNLTYNPACGTFCSQTSMQDRVALTVPNKTLSILDTIAPLTPAISTVSVADARELELQDGEFFTNTNTPTFHVIDPSGDAQRALAAGITVEIWEETNGEAGLQRGDGAGFDTLRGSNEVDGDTDCDDGVGVPEDTEPADPCEVDVATDFSADHPASGNTALDVYVVSHDSLPASLGGPNVSLESLEGLNLDFVLPILQGVTLQSGKMLVSFSESVPRGRNFASDWEAYNEDGLGRITFQSVALNANLAIRELNTSDADYDGEHVGLLRYIYSGPGTGSPESVRYEDRATNKALAPDVLCLPGGSANGIC